MKKMRSAVLASAFALVVSLPAAAQPPYYATRAPEPIERPFLLGANLGMGSPVGNVGVTLGWQPTPRGEIEFGVGRGYTGLQLSLMPKALLGPGALRLMLGAGPSYSTDGDASQFWLNGELGLALLGRHLFASVAGGLTYLVVGRIPAPCFFCDTNNRRYYDSPETFPTFRMTFGVRF
jgi:hypothetical protein